MSILAGLMTRFAFQNGRLIPTMPYKKGAAPAEVSESLSRIAVEHLDEVLGLNSFQFKKFERIGSGSSRWIGREGKLFQAQVDDYELRTQNKENTLKTLRHLRAQVGGDARLSYWVSGGDSFASVPTWTPEWRELFDEAHWVVISRSDVTDASGNVLFHVENPLKSHFDESFLAQYTYSFDSEARVHIYQNKDEARPNIYIVDFPSLGDSSTKNRASLAEKGDHQHAEQGLQPQVFKECLDKAYYSGAQEGEGFPVFTERNLETYLSWMYWKLQREHSGKLDPADERELRALTKSLLQIAEGTVAEAQAKALLYRILVPAFEHVFEHLRELTNLHKIGEKLHSVAKEYKVGPFAALYLLFELLENTLVPIFLTKFYGVEALLAAPFIHPNDLIMGTSFVAWNVLRKIREKQKLAGSLEAFSMLSNYRNRLMQGDPQATQLRMELRSFLGLGGEPLRYNVVRSRLPRFIPLFLRNLDDHRVRWYDLNVSTNELRALLGDEKLYGVLKESAGKNTGLLAYYLHSAVYERPESRTGLELFLMRRYFERLYLGKVPGELLGSLSEKERHLHEKIGRQAESLLVSLEPRDQKIFGERLADFYILSRVLLLSPADFSQESFWTLYFNQMLSRYPAKRAAANSANLAQVRERVQTALKLLEKSALTSNAFAQWKTSLSAPLRISFRGHDVVNFQEKLNSSEELSPSEELTERLLSESVAAYVESLPEIFSLRPDPEMEPADMRLVSANARVENIAEENLYFQMRSFESEMDREFERLEIGFVRAKAYFEKRHQDAKMERAYKHALSWLEKEREKLGSERKSLEFEILRAKYPYQLTKLAERESDIPNFDSYRSRFEELKLRSQKLLAQFREMNQTMSGFKPSKIANVEELRVELGRIFESEAPSQMKFGTWRCALSLL
jgi:nicotinic acid mononucleotide adenylyltransferase